MGAAYRGSHSGPWKRRLPDPPYSYNLPVPLLRMTIQGRKAERELDRPVYKAGRLPSSDLVIDVKEASRDHFRIGRLKDGGWAVQDAGSTNGTLLNGEPVKTAKLKHKDKITVGPDCELVFWDPPDPTKIVLKSKADKFKEEKEAAFKRKLADKRQEREAAAAKGGPEAADTTQPGDTTAAQPVAQGTDTASTPEDTSEDTAETEPEPAPVETLAVDSEERLVQLLKDRDAFDRYLAAGPKAVVFGTYQLKQRLSEGGMGYVFKALHQKTNKHVALKVLRTEVVDEENIARFQQEAWAISAFNHKNIVQVSDLGRHCGMHYIAMDYVDGADLLKVGFKRTLTFWQIMEVTDKIADVLRLVHARKIWHRDIKPQNILLDRSGEVKLIDFGIATVERAKDDATKTAEGLIMGTPAFLSPEQASRGKMAVDGRADLYSLGAVLYYMLTGRRPFTGRSALEVLKKNMTAMPPHPCDVEEHAPRGLADLCINLMQKHPEDRCQSAEELQAELAKWRKSKDGKMELDRHKKIMKLRARKAQRLG